MTNLPNSTIEEIVKQIEDQELIISAAREIQADVYKAAAMKGYHKAYLRKVIGRRKKERQAILEEDAAIAALEEELGMPTDILE